MFVPPFWPNLWMDFSKKFQKMVAMVMRKTKIGIFARKTFGATDLKLGMHIQFHSWV